MENHNDTIIIKSARDEFERTVNNSFERSGIIVIPTEDIVKNKTGLRKIIQILKALYSMRKQYRNVGKVMIFEETTLYLVAIAFWDNCYLWLWNTYGNSKKDIIKLKCSNRKHKVYSFDEGDCKKYSIKYNTQFCIDYMKQRAIPETQDKEYDLYFVGRDKGRYELVLQIYDYCCNEGLTPLFQIVPDEYDKSREYEKKIISNKLVDYSKVIENIAKSRAVLDICKNGQSGATFRAMEALSLGIKIVTNNLNYKNLEFYSPDMVYVIEDDSLTGLIGFLKKGPGEYNKSAKDYYSIDNWIKRF